MLCFCGSHVEFATATLAENKMCEYQIQPFGQICKGWTWRRILKQSKQDVMCCVHVHTNSRGEPYPQALCDSEQGWGQG